MRRDLFWSLIFLVCPIIWLKLQPLSIIRHTSHIVMSSIKNSDAGSNDCPWIVMSQEPNLILIQKYQNCIVDD
jgi:hypothetical protein